MHQAALPHALLDVPVLAALVDSARRVVREHFESKALRLGGFPRAPSRQIAPTLGSKVYK